jgi:hypothetical protein
MNRELEGGHYLSPDGSKIVEIRKIREGQDYKFQHRYMFNAGFLQRAESEAWIRRNLRGWIRLDTKSGKRR